MISEVNLKLKKAKVRISPSHDDEVHVVSSLPIQQERTDQRLTLEYDQSRTLELEVEVPSSIKSLDLNLGWGPVTINGMSLTSADLNVGLGNLMVDASKGEFDINVGKGNVTMQNFNGQIDINAGLGAVLLQHLNASGDVNDGLGNITLDDCRGAFDINAGKGDIMGNGLSGHMDANAGMGSIVLRNSRKLSIEANSGFGQIQLLGGLFDHVECESGIGSVTVEARVASLAVDVKNRGDVHVSIPTSQGARIEASTDQGRVVSQMELVEVNNPGPARGHRLVGSVGDGSTHIQLHTRRGTITLGQFAETSTGPDLDQDIDNLPTDPRLQILEQLQQGLLTVDEADDLLQQLDENDV